MSAWLECALVFSTSCAVSLAVIPFGRYLERRSARVSDDEKALRDLLAWVSVSDSRICKFWVDVEGGRITVETKECDVYVDGIGRTFAEAARVALDRGHAHGGAT